MPASKTAAPKAPASKKTDPTKTSAKKSATKTSAKKTSAKKSATKNTALKHVATVRDDRPAAPVETTRSLSADVAATSRDARALLQDATHVTLGLGVLAYQQIQVRRREIRARMDSERARLGDQADSLANELKAAALAAREQIAPMVGRVEPMVAPLVGFLGGTANEVAQQIGAQLQGAQINDRLGDLRDRVEPWARQARALVPEAVTSTVDHLVAAAREQVSQQVQRLERLAS